MKHFNYIIAIMISVLLLSCDNDPVSSVGLTNTQSLPCGFDHVCYWEANSSAQDDCARGDSVCIENHYLTIGEPTDLVYYCGDAVPAECSVTNNTVDSIAVANNVMVDTIYDATGNATIIIIDETGDTTEITPEILDSLIADTNVVVYDSIAIEDTTTTKITGYELCTSRVLEESEICHGGLIYPTITLNYDNGNSRRWFAKNLNIGTRVDGANNQTDIQGNDTLVEKFCYNDDEANCDIYGGLYQWAEMLNRDFHANAANDVTSNTDNGLCPEGWYIPTRSEYLDLIGVGEKYGVYPAAPLYGTDPNTEAVAWNNSVIGDQLGFTVLPGGYRISRFKDEVENGFVEQFTEAHFWTRERNYNGLTVTHASVYFTAESQGIQMDTDWNTNNTTALSVRCVTNPRNSGN